MALNPAVKARGSNSSTDLSSTPNMVAANSDTAKGAGKGVVVVFEDPTNVVDAGVRKRTISQQRPRRRRVERCCARKDT